MTLSPAERRAWVRYPCQLETSCQPVVAADATTWAGKLLDLSEGGVGVVLSRRFEAGTLLAIEIPEKDGGGGTRSLVARVVRVTRYPAGDWLLGCSFVRPLSDEDVKALL